MIHDNPYDAAEAAAYEDDRRQALQDGAEEAETERWLLARASRDRKLCSEMQAPSIIED